MNETNPRGLLLVRPHDPLTLYIGRYKYTVPGCDPIYRPRCKLCKRMNRSWAYIQVWDFKQRVEGNILHDDMMHWRSGNRLFKSAGCAPRETEKPSRCCIQQLGFSRCRSPHPPVVIRSASINRDDTDRCMPIPLRGIELGGMVTDDAVSLSPHLHSGLSILFFCYAACGE